ncbi:MAG: response regulator, partial [Gammaproteobacteria bacterium]|nr:response regulator [Gammaproteobacteria bacterium]
KAYHREDGLQGEEFNFNAYYRTRDGRLCFGGPGGINIFDPAALYRNAPPPNVVLTRVEVLGVPLSIPTPYGLLQQISLGPTASIVSFDFAALDYAAPHRDQLAYRLTGLTNDWINLGAQRRVTLTNLDAGSHVLEVRARGADSVWSAKPFSLTIHKAPSLWRSPQAYTAYVIGLVLVIALGIRVQRGKLRRALAAKESLETEVAMRTQQLREANRELVAASKAKSAFLARMGHELRTPMNGVVGMAELLARTPLTTAQRRHARTICSSAQALLQILNDLLDLSKAQAGKIQLESLPIDLTQLLEETTALFAGAAESKAVELIVCPAEAELVVLGDPLRLRQVLLNLIGNAVKFTERGAIVVRCDVAVVDVTRANVSISVSDSGIGMEKATLAKIFEPFSQADETTSRRFGGTGLGLSICQELIELMDGAIKVESEPQVGSTFTVSVQLKIAEVKPAKKACTPTGRGLAVITHGSGLAESLRRYCALLGVPVLRDASAARVAIIDADSCADELSAHRLALSNAGDRRLLIVASPRAILAQRLEQSHRHEWLLRKPLHRDALREALDAAFGTQGAKIALPATAVPDLNVAHRGHVLIVEDDAVNAAVAQGYLAELGCRSVWVASGEEAVARSAVERFDMVLMDLNMPGLDGYATTALIRKGEREYRVPIIALTANEPAQYREACLRAGMDDIMSKPYTIADCAAVIRRWMSSSVASEPDSGRMAFAEHLHLTQVDSAAVDALRKIRAGGATGLYAKLVALFHDSSTESLSNIAIALEKQDLAGARAWSHKLKSGAANVGALAFAGVVGELEQACAANYPSRARVLLDRLLVAQPGLLEELTACSLKASA